MSLKDALEKYLELQLGRVTGPRQLSMRTYRDSKDECEYILRKLPSRTAIHNLSPKHFQTLEQSYRRTNHRTEQDGSGDGCLQLD